jgi:hypothetical protein
MNIIETLSQVFPGATLGYVAGGTLRAFEISELVKNFSPHQCEILARGHEPPPAAGMRREYFLVQTEEALLYFRVCSGPHAQDAECAIGLGYADRQEKGQTAQLAAEAHRAILKLTEGAASPLPDWIEISEKKLPKSFWIGAK